MGDLHTGSEMDVIGGELLSKGQTTPEIKDEIYCQIWYVLLFGYDCVIHTFCCCCCCCVVAVVVVVAADAVLLFKFFFLTVNNCPTIQRGLLYTKD